MKMQVILINNQQQAHTSHYIKETGKLPSFH